MPQQIRLDFDRSIIYGSKEHYFHFLWGYVFPSLHRIFFEMNDRIGNVQFCFESCGPVMNKILMEIIEKMRLDALVLNRESFLAINDFEIIPRWDVYLLRDYFLQEQHSFGSFPIIKDSNKGLLNTLSDNNFFTDFKKNIFTLKKLLLSFFIPNSLIAKVKKEYSPYLLLKRSEITDFYDVNGEAISKGYGKQRRALLNEDDFVRNYMGRGLLIETYEPGMDTFEGQADSFYSAKGVIGIKGAEFANLFWMREGSKVLLIKPSTMNTPAVQMKLARLLGLEFSQIESDEGDFIDLLKLNIKPYLL